MTGDRRARVRRLDTQHYSTIESTLTKIDWIEGFGVSLAELDARSSEHAARAMFEAAPTPVRWLLLLGWRRVLGLRLDPGASTGHVLGWPISSANPGEVVLVARSRLLTAVKTVRTAEWQLIVTTAVQYESNWGRIIWRMVLPVHYLTEPYLLARAARRHPTVDPR
jgi:hypothetical protein